MFYKGGDQVLIVIIQKFKVSIHKSLAEVTMFRLKRSVDSKLLKGGDEWGIENRRECTVLYIH